jgi:PAS domain S-box-containing protein
LITREKFNREVFRDIVQSVPVAIVAVSQSGEVESWNLAAERILGWTADEVAGQTLPIDLPTSVTDGEVELQRSRKDGESIVVRARTIPWNDASGAQEGSLIILTDVTDRKTAESVIQDLTEQERQSRRRELEHVRFRELLESAPDAIIEVDQVGTIVLLNKGTEQMFGYGRWELLGKSVEILIPENVRQVHHRHRHEYWQHPSRRPMGTGLKLEGRRKDGSTFPVEISLSPVAFEENFRVSAIIRDVSERQLAEEHLRSVQSAYAQELAAKNHELEARNEEVERANNLKSEFLSGMSHELRTPLHTIIGFAELLEEQMEDTLSEKQLRYVRHIHRDSQHLLALINDVLDLSKIESGRLELHREPFPLEVALEETIASIRPRAHAKSIEVSTDMPAAVTLYADRLRFKQILYNLLTNAVKFTPEGGRVSVSASVADDVVETCVSDTGIGIAASQHESVFDKFYQVGQRQAGGLEGTGLGLAITRQLVEAHGGTIRLNSEPGKGSQFTFTIPHSPQELSPPPAD